jgi:hypothetical protein
MAPARVLKIRERWSVMHVLVDLNQIALIDPSLYPESPELNRQQASACRLPEQRRRHLAVDQGAIADNKRLGPMLTMIRAEQLRRGLARRSGPRRRDQRDARLFKVG